MGTEGDAGGFPGVTDIAGLRGAVAVLASFTASFAGAAPLLGRDALLEAADLIEGASRLIEVNQVTVAHAIDTQNLAATGGVDTRFVWDVPAGGKSPYRRVQDLLIERLRISRSAANRRVFLGRDLLPCRSSDGTVTGPVYPLLAGAAADGAVSGETLNLAVRALNTVRVKATAAQLTGMETVLAGRALTTDPDTLARDARERELQIDRDAGEPTAEELTERQGVHDHGMYRGLHHVEIFAAQPQYEVLQTVMNTGTNPRTYSLEQRSLDQRTRPQKLLDALTGACGIALRAGELPESGGNHAQVLVTVDYRELFDKLATGRRAGEFMFTGAVTAENVRELACNADLIPVVLGAAGEVLDQGRSRRLHTRAQRLALTARDRGCSRPGCTMPAAWTECHHVRFWDEHHGRTSVNNGALACTYDHHLIHQGRWKILMKHGLPYWVAPQDLDPSRTPRRNTYFNPPRPGAPETLPPLDSNTNTGWDRDAETDAGNDRDAEIAAETARETAGEINAEPSAETGAGLRVRVPRRTALGPGSSGRRHSAVTEAG
ncbi:HNH endonuclease signature motif containing protein [Paenarthrobacter sp. PH39-S1]|uniref:HNH endonuclease signature motif containing protein n=1 Tax=Paenarthrobacter sp. PH39-S1 TaxID=3046204 RepID=UPI0024B9DAA0|nr:HNH endonuclease signature motif containing protein [Paenarthrobacter sp. PH39-S1]MDJ0356277.1 DUF222 domain-containing protein [Paenarthrobacter sp. PH39-S1]